MNSDWKGKKETKSLFADVLLYIKTSKDATPHPNKNNKKYQNPSVNSANLKDRKFITKSVVFPYTNNELTETEDNNNKKKAFTILSKRIKYLGTNLTKEVKDLFTENYKKLRKAVKDDTDKKINYAHGLG